MAEQKKYWLKLNKDFLKSPQIKVIKNMPNGKDYVIFYLALMLESIETVGHLKFTSFVPYNAEMLASITETNVDIVRSATKLFCEIGLMQIFDDGTIFIPQVPEITGRECESAERVRQFRNREKQKLLHCNNDVTKSNCNIDINKDIDKDIDKEEDKEDIKEKLPKANKRDFKSYGEFANVLLTDEQYSKLKTFWSVYLSQGIETLSEYIASTGRKYKNHYAVLGKNNWVYKTVTDRLRKEGKIGGCY